MFFLFLQKKNTMKSCKPTNLNKDCHDSSPDASQEVVFAVSTTAGTISSPPTQTTSPVSICHNNPNPAFNSSLKDTASSAEKGLTISRSSLAAVMTASTTITTSCTMAATCLKAPKFGSSDCDKLTECGQVATPSAKLEAKTYARAPHICDNSQSQYNENLQNSVRSYSKPRKCLLDSFKRTVPSVPSAPVPALVSAHASSVRAPTTIPSTSSPQASMTSNTALIVSTSSQTHSTSASSYSLAMTSPSPIFKSVTSSSTSPLASTSLPLSSVSPSSLVTSSSTSTLSSPATIPPFPHQVSSSPVIPKPTPFLIPSPITKSAVSTAAQTCVSSTKSIGDSLSSKTTAASPNKTGGACRFVMGPMPPSGFFRRNISSRSLGISIVSSTANSITTTTTTTTTPTTAATAVATTSNNQATTTITAVTSTSTNNSSSSSCTNISLGNISRTCCSPSTSSTMCTSVATTPRLVVNLPTNVRNSQTLGNLTSANTIPILGGKPTTAISSNNLVNWSSSIAIKGNLQASLPSSDPSVGCVSRVSHQTSSTAAGITSSACNSPTASCAANANKEAFPRRGVLCNLYRDRLSTFHSPTAPKTAPFTPPHPPVTCNAAPVLTYNPSPCKKPLEVKASSLTNCSVNRTFKNEPKGHPLKGPYEISKLNTIIEEDEEKEFASSSDQVTCDNNNSSSSLVKAATPQVKAVISPCKSESLSNEDTVRPSVKVPASAQAATITAKKPPSKKASVSPTAVDDDDSETDTAPEDCVETEKSKFSEVRVSLRKERLKLFAQARRNRTLIDLGNGTIMCPTEKKELKKVRHLKHPKYFESIIYKVNNYLYHSVVSNLLIFQVMFY